MNARVLKDGIARRTMALFCAGVVVIFAALIAVLFLKSGPAWSIDSLAKVIASTRWHPTEGAFGLGSFITGTAWVSLICMIIAVPLSVCAAIFLSEYAHDRAKRLIKPVIDVCAGISPVVYGVWGVLVIVPAVRSAMPYVCEILPFFPFESSNHTGYSALAGGIVLAVMVSPLIIFITEGVLSAVPRGMRDASIALGATKWQTIRNVVLVRAWPGIIAAIMLGMSRAVGETMAVLMVSGCSISGKPASIFDPAYPLPAMIANTYGEMMSIPLYDAAVMFAAFILLVITMLFNLMGWGILLYVERKTA